MTSASHRTALVTGASRGIGRAAAIALAAGGTEVLVHYGRGADEADAVVQSIRAAGGVAHAIGADLAMPSGAAELASKTRALVGDRLDVLVANAGISKAATIGELTIDDFDKLYAVNVRAPFFLVQELLPVLKDGSSIVFTSSAAARMAIGNIAAYAATKGAVDTLVRHLAASLGPQGVRVNAVAPGIVDTDMSSFTKTEQGRDLALSIQALKRVAQPDDIGSVIAFLASAEAGWITGQTLAADGGARL